MNKIRRRFVQVQAVVTLLIFVWQTFKRIKPLLKKLKTKK